MSNHHHFNYIELPTAYIAEMKIFYTAVFGWGYVDYGPTYAAITGAGDQGTLVVLYSDDLEASEQAVKDANGEITVPIFDFPGGRRFHFKDPSGNELAVWTSR